MSRSLTSKLLKAIWPNYHRLMLIEDKLNKILEIIDEDQFFDNRERQVARNLSDIRADHLGRYEFAAKYIDAGDKVLDAACGIGYGSYILASEAAAEMTAVDISEKSVHYAKKHYSHPNIRYLNEDCLALDFEKESFDTVVSFETVEHLDEYETFISNVAGFLKHNGKLICSTPNQELLPFSKDKFPFHVRHFTPAEMKAILIRQGFKLNEVYSQPDSKRKDVVPGERGLFNIFVAQKA